MVLTSPGPSEGKSLTASNLAVVLAQAGLSVILVDADLRRPVIHKIFSLKNNIGLTTWLVGQSTEPMVPAVAGPAAAAVAGGGRWLAPPPAGKTGPLGAYIPATRVSRLRGVRS